MITVLEVQRPLRIERFIERLMDLKNSDSELKDSLRDSWT
jgi:hypothetical protein